MNMWTNKTSASCRKLNCKNIMVDISSFPRSEKVGHAEHTSSYVQQGEIDLLHWITLWDNSFSTYAKYLKN